MPSSNNQQLQVAAIKNGTVIDHITAGSALKIIRLLNLPSKNALVTVGLNLPSKKMKHKDLIKVAERALTPEEASLVALFAPEASINIIKNYAVGKKFNAMLPEFIAKVVVCPNLKCITNHEPMSSRFRILLDDDRVYLVCIYCQKTFQREEITEYRI